MKLLRNFSCDHEVSGSMDLFAFCLSKEAVRSSGYAASNYRMISKL
jgi:hypothetical protein